MKKTIMALMLAAFTTATTHAAGILDGLTYNLRFGYSIGGSMPIGMPASIRSINRYTLEPNFSLGLGIHKHLNDKWGLATGLYLENKGMNIDATVKNYHIEIIRGGQRLEGQFTGRNATEVEQWMLTLPLQVSYAMKKNLHLKLGPYISYVRSHTFRGYAYDGYIRIGDPTGAKVEIGSDEGNRGSYDFSDDMRELQFGMMFSTDWFFYKAWGAFFDLSWGVTGIFNNGFDTIEQTLYPVYATIGVSYKIK